MGSKHLATVVCNKYDKDTFLGMRCISGDMYHTHVMHDTTTELGLHLLHPPTLDLYHPQLAAR